MRDAEAWLEGLIDHERRAQFDYAALGLRRVEALLDALDHPERGLPCVHVAGSKGKGVVTLAAECLLRATGRRSAAFTSPHLETWRERFRIDAAPVSEPVLLEALGRVRPAVERLRADPALRPSFFDVSTALGLLLFREAGVEAAAIEVGLGGRLDSTRCVESAVSVITSIQLEHTDKLGSTHAAIAAEKAGILRPGVPVVCGPLPPQAEAVVRVRASRIGAPLLAPRAHDVRLTPDGVRFRLDDGRALRAPLLGAHQALNLALAVCAVECLAGRALSERELGALSDLRVPARIELIGDVVLDCAHTPESVAALTATLEQLWPGRAWGVLISVSRDKDAARIAAALPPGTLRCVATRAEPVRSLPPRELAAALAGAGIESVECEPDPLEALARLRAAARPGEGIVVTGSVYLAGAVRRELTGEPVAP